MDSALRERIQQQVSTNEVVLFMKGTRQAPQCGFSATVVGILDELIDDYTTVNVLADDAIRNGIKEFSEWPTIPQLYIKGEFVGGCDIVKEMYGDGQLEEALGVSVEAAEPPELQLSDTAAAAFKQALQSDSEVVRLEIDARFNHGLSVGPVGPKDAVVEVNGVRIAVDRGSAKRAQGVSIDYVDSDNGPAFKIDNPNEPPRVKTISVRDLETLLESRDAPEAKRFELLDVRTPQEREIAHIEGSELLDPGTQKRIAQLDKTTPLVFVCHHGMRSGQAAEFFLNLGFTNVTNVAGGIDAYAAEVDPNLKRY